MRAACSTNFDQEVPVSTVEESLSIINLVKSNREAVKIHKRKGVLALLLTASVLAFHSSNLEVWGCSEAYYPSKNPSRVWQFAMPFLSKQSLALQDEAQSTPASARSPP